MTFKKVKYLLPAEKMDMDGFPILQALPTQKVDQVDPFLLLHHARVKYSNNRPAKSQGVGPHPHRGFAPVTFVVEGEVHHRDSRGHSQIAKAGDVQWLTAGRGIIHSERPSEALAESKGHQEIIQLWINSPAQNKMDPPHYQYLSEGKMPSFESNDGRIINKLVAGKMEGQRSEIQTQSDLLILWTKSDAGGAQTLNLPQRHNTLLYLISGSVTITGYGLVDSKNLVVFEHDHEPLGLTFQDTSQCLILSGRPLQESIVRSGPFVMNSETEILQAMRDYQLGKMGILIEE